MNRQPHGSDIRLTRLERELLLWRIIGLTAIAFLVLAFDSSGPDKELRFVNADGSQTVILSADGLSLLTKDKTLARLSFAPVGESESLEAELMLSGGLRADGGLSVRAGKDVALLNAEHLNFLQGAAKRASLSTDGLDISDTPGRARITLSTPDQGVGGLVFLDQQRAILALGSLGLFLDGNPPRKDVGAIQLGDFGPTPRHRLITPSEQERRPH